MGEDGLINTSKLTNPTFLWKWSRTMTRLKMSVKGTNVQRNILKHLKKTWRTTVLDHFKTTIQASLTPWKWKSQETSSGLRPLHSAVTSWQPFYVCACFVSFILLYLEQTWFFLPQSLCFILPILSSLSQHKFCWLEQHLHKGHLAAHIVLEVSSAEWITR